MLHLALLRGINVGGKAKLPMNELAALFAASGAQDIRTFIQSGNVIFNAAEPEHVVAAVTTEIAKIYGYPGRIVLRSAREMQRTFSANPFAASPPATLHCYFLVDWPDRKAVEALDSQRSPGDSFVVHGREIYLVVPNGMARTRLTNAYFDTKLATVSTARNWNTVGKLVEIMT
jgi:uncharacterized protein (DUF1697 family)